MISKEPGTRPWTVAMTCVVALATTWLSYFAVYDVLPSGTPLAHWGLFCLAIGSTAGLLITLERVMPRLPIPMPARSPRA